MLNPPNPVKPLNHLDQPIDQQPKSPSFVQKHPRLALAIGEAAFFAFGYLGGSLIFDAFKTANAEEIPKNPPPNFNIPQKIETPPEMETVQPSDLPEDISTPPNLTPINPTSDPILAEDSFWNFNTGVTAGFTVAAISILLLNICANRRAIKRKAPVLPANEEISSNDLIKLILGFPKIFELTAHLGMPNLNEKIQELANIIRRLQVKKCSIRQIEEHIIKHIKEEDMRFRLRKELKFIEQDDFLYEKSLSDMTTEVDKNGINIGLNAAGVIVMNEAMLLLQNPKSFLKYPNEVYEEMANAIQFYKAKKYNENNSVDTVIKDLQNDPKCPPFKLIKECSGKIEDALNNTLTELQDLATKNNQKACGVLTLNNETLLVFFREPNKPAIFDPYSRPSGKLYKGASIRYFDDDIRCVTEYVQKYVQGFGKSANFHMKLLAIDQDSKKKVG